MCARNWDIHDYLLHLWPGQQCIDAKLGNSDSLAEVVSRDGHNTWLLQMSIYAQLRVIQMSLMHPFFLAISSCRKSRHKLGNEAS